MGEYAKYNGQEIKIGTCESMYYLRADQAHLVKPLRGSLDPVRECESIRFRFPFPDEDNIQPGAFKDYQKSVGLYGLEVETGFKHFTVQFQNPRGYLISLPCPEVCNQDGTLRALKFHRNGNPGPVRIVQQKVFNGMLVTVVECGGCGIAWRLETLEMAQLVLDALQKMAKDPSCNGEYFAKIAERITEGYVNPPDWVKQTRHEPVTA